VDRFIFDPLDPELTRGGQRVDPPAILGVLRKLLELRACAAVCSEVKGGSVVRDGDLERSHKLIAKELEALRANAEGCGVTVAGLSKTSRVCTDAGNSALAVLQKWAPDGCWVYDVGGKVVFVRLHPKSGYVFRCDLLEDGSRDFLCALASNSKDPAFLGYPYGLVDADKFAQVTKNEAFELRARFALRSRERFSAWGSALDAHDILNRL